MRSRARHSTGLSLLPVLRSLGPNNGLSSMAQSELLCKALGMDVIYDHCLNKQSRPLNLPDGRGAPGGEGLE